MGNTTVPVFDDDFEVWLDMNCKICGEKLDWTKPLIVLTGEGRVQCQNCIRTIKEKAKG
jgi:hypothetical protein